MLKYISAFSLAASISIGLTQPALAKELTDSAALDIIYAHDRFNPEARKTMYKMMKVQTAIEQYKSNPKSFRLPTFSKTTGRIIDWERQSLEEVKKMVWNNSSVEVDGFSMSNSKFFKTASEWANTIPGVNLTTSLALKTFGSIYDKSGKIPSMEDVKIEGFGQSLIQLKKNHTDIYHLVLKDYENVVGHSLESPAKNPIVREALNSHQTEETLSKVKQLVDHLSNLQQQITDKELDRKRKEEIQRKYREKKQKVLGSIGATGQALTLFGDEKAASTVDRFGKFLDVAIDLDHFGKEMNPIQLANGYLLAANIAMSLFGTQGASPEQKMMELMREILESIQILKDEMNGRFDRIDRTLAKIMGQIDLYQALDTERHKSLQHQLDLVNERLTGLFKKIDSGTIAEVERDNHLTIRQACLNEDPSKQIFQKFDDQKFNDKCLSPTIGLSHEKITYNLLNLSFSPYHEIQWGGDWKHPYEAHLPSVLKKIAETNQHESIRLNRLGEIPNYSLWKKSTDLFLDLFDKYAISNPIFSDLDFRKVESAGQQLMELRQTMIISDNKLRWNVLDSLLDEYQSRMENYANKAKKIAADPTGNGGGFDSSGFDVTKPLDQPISYVIPADKRTISFCDGNRNGGIHHYIVVNNGKTETAPERARSLYSSYIHVPKFQLPKGFENAISSELLWVLKKYPQNTGICIERISIPTLRQVVTNDKNPYVSTSYLDISFDADVRLQIQFNGKEVSTAQFSKSYSLPRMPAMSALNAAWATILYQQIWYGWDGPKDYPNHNIFRLLTSQSVFQNINESQQAFAKGLHGKNYIDLMTALKEAWISELESRAKDHLTQVAFKAEILEIQGILNVLAGAVFLGINDRVEEKRWVEGALSMNTTLPDSNNQTYVAQGLIDLEQMINMTIDKDLSHEEIKDRIISGINTFKSTLKSLEESGGTLRPEGPKWLTDRLNEIEIRRARMSQINKWFLVLVT